MNYDKIISQTAAQLPPSGIRKFFDIVSQMKDAISLGVGEPDFVTAWNVREAAIWALERGRTHYTSNWGTVELRQEIARYQQHRFGVSYNPDNEIVVTIGASEAIDLAMRVLVNPGDEVLLPSPSYVSYMPTISLAGGVAVPIEARAENNFRITPQEIKACITPKTKAIILPFPNNPTGAILTQEDLQAIADCLQGTDIMVITDEIYAELTYGTKHVSFASIPGMKDRTILISGMSKAFAMTGWRIGYVCGPVPIVAAMCKIHQYTIMCAPAEGQAAAAEALRSNYETGYAEVERMVREYNRRRNYIISSLQDMGLPCNEPFGAFYAFPSIAGTGLTSQEFSERLLREQKVAVVPGTAFGPSGEGYIRCSYATSMELITQAMQRMAAFVRSL